MEFGFTALLFYAVPIDFCISLLPGLVLVEILSITKSSKVLVMNDRIVLVYVEKKMEGFLSY